MSLNTGISNISQELEEGQEFVCRESVLEASTDSDPFSGREGKALIWRNVTLKLAASGKDGERILLHNVWGEVPPKETTAIMGHSGSGT
jgi:ABC-type multidrug transport system fused ATPase/permease subunit